MRCNHRSSAFTLIEVLASVIVLSVGLFAAIGLMLYGLQLAKLSMGRATGLATAMSVAVDPTPIQPVDPFWTVAVPGTTSGYLNGYFVRRNEAAATVIAPGLTASDVEVDVFETFKGRLVASYNQRIVRETP